MTHRGVKTKDVTHATFDTHRDRPLKVIQILFLLFLVASTSTALAQEAPPEDPPKAGENSGEKADKAEKSQDNTNDKADETGDPKEANPDKDDEDSKEARDSSDEKSKEAEPTDPAEVDSYASGFNAMRAMNWSRAHKLLKAHLEAYPKGDTAAGARELMALAKALQIQTGNTGKNSGRTELVAFSTLYGIWAGIATSIILELDEGALLTTFLTGGGGLATSLLLTRGKDVTDGEAALVSTLGTWGTWNGVALAIIFDVDDPNDVLRIALTAGVAGISGAVLLNQKLSLSAGDVALVSTGGTWGTFLAGMGLLITNADLSSEGFAGTLLVGSDAGLVAGALLAQNLEVSRGRMRLIDLSGALGALLAGGVMALGDASDSQLIGTGLSVGAIGGLALGTYLSADWDAPEEKGVNLMVPTPFITSSRNGEKVGTTIGINLLQGQW